MFSGIEKHCENNASAPKDLGRTFQAKRKLNQKGMFYPNLL